MKVTTILPVFNEEKTITNVLRTLINSNLINEIVVVNDASTDNTLNIIRSFNSKKLKIISLEKNVGKSDAVKIATQNLETDILFFCDGDLHNFNEEHVRQILKPFKRETRIMSAGIRDYGTVINFLSKQVFPLITGERALPYSVFEAVRSDPLMKGYGLEIVLNNYYKINNIPIYKSILKGLRQTNKPIKRKNGFYLLLKQSIEIIQIKLKLNFRNYKNHVR